jgi:protoporphyrin/coproporphyrin ferrochelatase
MTSAKGVLLVNIGTPDSPQTPEVAVYLREFLMDPDILPIPGFFRWLLVHVGIVWRRAPASAKKYQSIWTSEGSPLMVHSLAVKKNLQAELGADYAVEIGMRYGNPSIESALLKFQSQGVKEIFVLPLYPQYCRATTESSFKKIDEVMQKHQLSFHLHKLQAFWSNHEFIQAVVDETRRSLQGKKVDFYQMTYHGLPESQNSKMEPMDSYKLRCQDTSKLIADALGLNKDQWGVSFQSRVGVETWIKPYTDEELKALPGRGVKNLAVLCPSFVADCLETVEEIGMEGRETFLHAGGENYYLVPCVNGRADYLKVLVKSLEHTEGED